MARLLSKDGIVRLFGSAVVAQAVLSAANLAVGLLLLRYASDEAYGRFVLVQAAVLLAMVAQRAYVVDPLTVIAPERDARQRAAMVGAIQSSQRRALILAMIVLLAALAFAWLAGLIGGVPATLVGATGLACWAALERDYLRGVLMLYYRPETVLGADVVYVGVLIAGVALATRAGAWVAVAAALALAAAGWAGRVPAARSLGRDPGWQTGDAAAYWREMRPLALWATVGAMIYWILGQGYNYVLALKLDTVAVAHVNAIRLLLMPTYLLTIGIKSLLLPMAMRWVEHGGFGLVVWRLSQFIVALAALDAVYVLALWLGGADWILVHLLDKQIPGAAFMLLMWALLSLINLVRDVYLTALLVRRRFKNTARLVAVTAAVTIVTMWFALDYLAAPGALVGLAAGESIFLAGVLWMVWREARLAPADETGRAAAQARS